MLEISALGPRMSFQRWWGRQAKGKVLNVGCADDPMGLGPKPFPPGLNLDVVQFDLDRWNHPKCVQGDAHYLPFANRSFDLVIIGDVHEHLVDPLKASLEAARVSNRLLVFTIFEEWRLPGYGQFLTEGYARNALDTQRAFKGKYANQDEYFAAEFPQCHVVSDKVQPHHYHINQFADQDMYNLIDQIAHSDPEWQLRAGWKVPEQQQDDHEWSNWLLAFERVTT